MNVREKYENDIQILTEVILAIETGNNLEFVYQKEVEVSAVRKVSPYNLYWNSDNTKLLLDAYQISGYSNSQKVESFKQFDCKFIKNVLILDEKFEINLAYNPKSIRYKNSIIDVVI